MFYSGETFHAPGVIAYRHSASRLVEIFAAAAFVAASLVTVSGSAFAHEAKPTGAMPKGWTYPFACCSGYDCREVAAQSISERPEGYVINGTGEVVAYTDRRIRNSPDGEFHWCSVAGAHDGRTICLFVPPRGY
jgi:hypothetical protein